MTKIHLDKVENLAGFALERADPGASSVKVLTRAALTSDEPEFYTYIEHLSSMFFGRRDAPVNRSAVVQFLAVLHADGSADVYINDFTVVVEIQAKRDIKAGELVSEADIADVRRLRIPEIPIADSDKVIYCFKVGWRFGLVFDLDRTEKLDLAQFETLCGGLYRYLSFRYVYALLEGGPQFEAMIADGWFPFIQLLGRDYKQLIETYQTTPILRDRIDGVVGRFGKERIDRVVSRWWTNAVFRDKRAILEPAVNAFVRGEQGDFVLCIKTLYPEVEGIIRTLYFSETGKGDGVTTRELLKHLVEKGRSKSGSEASLFLPLQFFEYLANVVFARFSLEDGKVPLSRHSSSHGVATADDYTKTRALQAILTMDQIYFYL